jgi:hypothetical protein
MTLLHFTISKRPESDRWSLKINGTEALMTEEEFQALPPRLRKALLRAERVDEAAYAKRLAPKGLEPELNEAVEDFRERKGFWNLPPRAATGATKPKAFTSRFKPTLEDLGLD